MRFFVCWNDPTCRFAQLIPAPPPLIKLLFPECDPACINAASCVIGTPTLQSVNASQICVSDRISALPSICGPIQCKDHLAGFAPDGKTCLGFRTSTTAGLCRINSLGRSECSQSLEHCPKYSSAEPFITCGSPECSRADGCAIGANKTSTSVDTVCYTKQESPKCKPRSCSGTLHTPSTMPRRLRSRELFCQTF